MDNENKFWLTLWQSVLAFLAFVALLITIDNIHQRSTYADVMRDSADPVAVACAFKLDRGEHGTSGCVAYLINTTND